MKNLSKKATDWLSIMANFESVESDGEIIMRGVRWHKIGYDPGRLDTVEWSINEEGWRDLALACHEIAGWLEMQNINKRQDVQGNTNGE
jgi:hypothetical protein